MPRAPGLIPKRPELSGKGEAEMTLSFGNVGFVPWRWLIADEDGVIALAPGMNVLPQLS